MLNEMYLYYWYSYAIAYGSGRISERPMHMNVAVRRSAANFEAFIGLAGLPVFQPSPSESKRITVYLAALSNTLSLALSPPLAGRVYSISPVFSLRT